MEKGSNPVMMRVGMEKAVQAVLKEVIGQSKQITKKEERAQVATISAQDEEVGNLIADAMEKVGENGVITVEEGQTFGLEVDVVEGMQFDNGYISPYLVTDPATMEAVYKNAQILLVDGKISSVQDMIPILEKVAKSGQKELVIIAEDVEGEALTTLIINKLKGNFNVLAVKAPGFGDRRKEMLRDIAALTGATVISSEIGLKLTEAELHHLGEAKKVISTKDNTTIVDGKGDKAAIDARVSEIKVALDNTKSDFDKEKLAERLAKLTGGVAVVKVGAATEMELKEKKHRIEDAVLATKAATEEGILPGGGVALLRATSVIDTLKFDDEDIQIGANIIKQALTYPVKQIAENAGVDGDEVARKTLEKKDFAYGFDAKVREYKDLVKAGIIDPTKVVRNALQNASSAAIMLLTTEAAVADVPKKDGCCSSGGGMPGGMGGMGGMPGMM